MQFKVNNEIYDVVIIRKRTTRNTYIRVLLHLIFLLKIY